MNIEESLKEINVKVIGIDELDVLAQDLASDVWMPACDTETEYRQALEVTVSQVRFVSSASLYSAKTVAKRLTSLTSETPQQSASMKL